MPAASHGASAKAKANELNERQVYKVFIYMCVDIND